MWSLYLQLSISSSGHDTGLSPLSHILLDDFIYTQDFKLNTILYWKLANLCLLQISSLSLTAYLTSPHENHTSTFKLSRFKTPRTIPLPVSYISINGLSIQLFKLNIWISSLISSSLLAPSKSISKSRHFHLQNTSLIQLLFISLLPYWSISSSSSAWLILVSLPPVLFPSYILSTSIQFNLLKI